MSKGFVVFAQNTDADNYVKQAYALALSIQYSQVAVKNISLVTNETVPDEYKIVFDQIIPVPFGEATESSLYKAEHRWKLYHASPYDETIVLDTDMLMLEDISAWWEYCNNYDIKYCSRILNHKIEQVTDTVHRQTFIANKLSSPYSALHYFKKSQRAYEFYRVLEFVCNNWEWCWNKFAPDLYQTWLSLDLAVAVAIEIVGNQEEILDISNPMEFVHMKIHLQNWQVQIGNWQDFVLSNFKTVLTVGNIQQPKLFHYVEKDFLSDSLIKRLTELVSA